MSVEQTLLKELEDSKKWLDQENGGTTYNHDL
jgi:hypothetical protein